MNRRLWSLLFLLGSVSVQAPAEDLSAIFKNPPASAKPWVYWFWVNGNVTRAGITADLEAMSRVGIGGAYLFEDAYGEPAGPVVCDTPEWLDLHRFALAEARRLHLQVEVNSGMGWAGTGGPWIPLELAMQKLTTSEVAVQGLRQFNGVLPRPPSVGGYYEDIAVLAFPTPSAEAVKLSDYSPKVSSSADEGTAGTADLDEGEARPTVNLPRPEPQRPQWMQLEFPSRVTARMLSLGMIGNPKFGVAGTLEVSDNVKDFRTVQRFSGYPPVMQLNFPDTTARCFRLLFTRSLHPKMERVLISKLELGRGFRIENIAAKAAFVAAQTTLEHNIASRAERPSLPPDLTIAKANIVNISPKMDKDGRLSWDVPQGDWTLLRIGHTWTGSVSHPASKSYTGPECDKLSTEGARAGFLGYVERLLDSDPGMAGTTLVGTHVDSWEVGSQNWTPRMREEFRRLRGYDLQPFLPVITGRVVDSLEVSERFLWDLRETVSDLVRQNYAGELRRLANERGLQLSIEGYFNCPTDEIAYGGAADIPMPEFWWMDRDKPPGMAWSCQEMTSAAHVYGRRLVRSESFTAGDTERWRAYPGSMKGLADWAFCQGINQLVFHRYAMQPWPDRAPGMGMGKWGSQYERTETWWEESRPWHEYLARCQSVLQQGLFVADICYVEPEGATRPDPPASLRPTNSTERPGYNFDTCSPDAVLTRMTVKNGRLVLPDGMSYRILLLPDVETMTPQLLRKVKALADAGATIVGPKAPVKSPSLEGYPACDDEVRRLANELWGGGKIISDLTPAEVLSRQGVPPDFSSRDGSGMNNIRFTHRQIGATDVYFLSNKTRKPERELCSFRVEGGQPEQWMPDTGRIERLAVCQASNGCVRIPLSFEPEGSMFVVFRRDGPKDADSISSVTVDGSVVIDAAAESPPAATADPFLSVAWKGTRELVLEASRPGEYRVTAESGKMCALEVPPMPAAQPIRGPWLVSFDPKWGGPVSPASFKSLANWAARPEPGIRYYSGTATYRSAFDVDDAAVVGDPRRRTYLDLGRVAIIAAVKLNGKDMGILWKPPFRVETTGVLRSGENRLEVRVTNLWINRMIGDEHLPEDSMRDSNGEIKAWPTWLLEGRPSPTGRYTFVTWREWKRDDPLAESGLIGPVSLQTTARVSTLW